MIMKKMLILILTLLISFIFTGCWDRTEIDKLAIVVALGIDKIPGPAPILLTAQIVNPSKPSVGGEGGEEPFYTETVKGKSIYDAIHKFEKKSPRRLYFSHLAIYVIGEEMARSGIIPILDYLSRDHQFRRTTWVLETSKTAQEILQSSFQIEEIPAMGIEGIISQSKKSSTVELIQSKNFIKNLTSKSHVAVVPRLDLEEKETEKGMNLYLNGESVFKKDKITGYLTNIETRGLLWMLGKVKGGPAILQCPNDKDEYEDEYVVLDVKSTKSQVTPTFKDGKLRVLINIQSEGEFKEEHCTEQNTLDMASVKKLEALLNKQIKEEVNSSIQKAQNLEADIFGFSDQIYQEQPDKWRDAEKDWDQHFQQMEVNIHVSSVISKTGMIKHNIHYEK